MCAVGFLGEWYLLPMGCVVRVPFIYMFLLSAGLTWWMVAQCPLESWPAPDFSVRRSV